MSRLDELKKKIDELYLSKNKNRADWADWLYKNHIFLVAEEAGRLADRYDADKDLTIAAAMLHDVADAVMKREDTGHEEMSAKIAIEYLSASGFSPAEIGIIVNDAMKLHGCAGGEFPLSFEGKIMATADAVVHLTTNFYEHCIEVLKNEEPVPEIRKWALKKLERDFYNKIQLEAIREEVKNDYEKLKEFLSGEF